MLCTNGTEKECLEKGLFGDREWRLPYLKSIKKGDIGFLLNVTQDQLLGIFVAESGARLNIDPNAWNSEFPVQLKVKLIDKLQRVDKASDKLEKIVGLREIQREPFPYKVPLKNTYGPDITDRVLSLFRLTDKIRDYFKVTPPEEVGLLPEYKLEDVAGLKDVKHFVYQRILAPFEDEQAAYNLRLRIGGGILLFGPPGTGKTLMAMAIASHIHAKFIDISPSIIVGYPGEAERKIENIFASMDKEPRAVVFLDEAEWILSRREGQSSSVMQRITPVLLAQLSRIFKQRTKPIIVIAATNKDLDFAIKKGEFREDLYHRLNVVNTYIPPLRDRKEDVPILCEYFLEKFNKEFKRKIRSISNKLMKAFMNYDWPGNVREMENVIKRLVVLKDEKTILKEFSEKNKTDQDQTLISIPASRAAASSLKDLSRQTAQEVEKKIISNALQQTNWNRKKAAELLGINYKTLLYKLKKFYN